MADLLYTLYETAESVAAQWNAQGVSAIIPNDTTVIADGAATDGRPPMTNAQVNNIINRCLDVVNWMNGSASVPAGDNSKAVLSTVAAVQVNGKAAL